MNPGLNGNITSSRKTYPIPGSAVATVEVTRPCRQDGWRRNAPENEKVADLVHGDKTDDAARWLADHDLLDELRDRISAGGGYHALRELARRLIERDMSEELRELIEAADADTRQVILDAAVGASSAWMNATRVLADFGHKASRRYLARTLAREDRLEELRQRAEHGDEHARRWLDEAQ